MHLILHDINIQCYSILDIAAIATRKKISQPTHFYKINLLSTSLNKSSKTSIDLQAVIYST